MFEPCFEPVVLFLIKLIMNWNLILEVFVIINNANVMATKSSRVQHSPQLLPLMFDQGLSILVRDILPKQDCSLLRHPKPRHKIRHLKMHVECSKVCDTKLE